MGRRMQPPTYSSILAAYGERLFGGEWAAGVARLARVNERQVQRIRVAAREGREYPAARGVLAALGDALAPLARELDAYRRQRAPPA